MTQVVNKKVKLRLVGRDGNAHSLMGAFSARAKKEGWERHAIDAVIKEAMSGDYNHLLVTLANHCRDGGS